MRFTTTYVNPILHVFVVGIIGLPGILNRRSSFLYTLRRIHTISQRRSVPGASPKTFEGPRRPPPFRPSYLPILLGPRARTPTVDLHSVPDGAGGGVRSGVSDVASDQVLGVRAPFRPVVDPP